jgi:hypothetical protein
MSARPVFSFLSTYRGEHDYRHLPTGRRIRYNQTTGRTTSTDGMPLDAATVAALTAHRAAELAEQLAWLTARGLPTEVTS